MRGSAAWTLAATAALLSCGPTRAAVVVRVDTDITQGPGGDLRSVRVRVYSGYGATRTARHDSVRPIGDTLRLPFRFAVLPIDDAEGGVVTVEVAGCSDALCGDERPPGYTPVIVEQRAIVSFIPGQVWELPVLLASSCRGVDCDDVDPRLENTCRPETGTCGSSRVPPSGGPDASADAAAPPDGAQDAVVEVASPRDASADANADAAMDAGVPPDADAVVMDADAAVAMDRPADRGPDADVPAAGMDAAPDADVPAAGMDAAPDADAPAAGMDAAPDADAPAAGMDAAPDAAAPDAPADVPLEPVRSCGSGAAAQTCRASEDCCILGGCGCLLVAVCTPRGVIGCR